MDYSILFINLFAFLTSLYALITNAFKKDFRFINLLFIFFSGILAAIFSMLFIINAGLFPEFRNYAEKIILFLPVPASALLFCITAVYPHKKAGQSAPVILIALIASSIDYLIVIHAPLFTHAGLLINSKTAGIIQLSIILLFMAAVPVIIIFRINKSPYLRIKGTLKNLFAGMIFIYIIFAAVYAWGALILKADITNNPLISGPPLLILIIYHHIVYNIRNSNLGQYYLDSALAIATFLLLLLPVYTLLEMESRGLIPEEIHFSIKGVISFGLMVLIYRGTEGIRKKFHRRKYSQLVDIVNRILMSVDDIKHFSDTESFWNTLTKDSIAGLKETMGVTATYFFLPSRRENGYKYTYGYGPELNPSFLDNDSKISLFLSSIDSIFEKSYLATDPGLDPPEELLNFFHRNNIEIAMSFRSMSDNIIGFLLLGRLENGEPYTSEHISAFEIYRIKLQNLLITGLILDEVTAEQVEEHDTIVVETIKKRITPLEMPAIDGIRISSINLNNSPDGGDYFDAVKISRDKISVFISDLEYAGINSAILGLELFSIFHTRSFIFNSPDRVLNMMNQVIKTSRVSEKTARAACAIISSQGDILYSGASFNPLVIYDTDRDEFTEIDSPGVPLGADMDTRYQLTTGRLRDKSIGLIFSKGLLSACSNDGEFFTVDMVKDIIAKFSRETPAVITREIYQKFRDFTGGRKQLEDITIIIFKKVKADG